MAENLMVGSHKGSTKAYRDGWDRTFGKKEEEDEGKHIACSLVRCKRITECANKGKDECLNKD